MIDCYGIARPVFGLGASVRLEQKLDLDCLVRKLYLARIGSTQHASAEQGRQIVVYGLDVSSNKASGLTHGNRPGAAQGFEQRPALCGKHLPQ